MFPAGSRWSPRAAAMGFVKSGEKMFVIDEPALHLYWLAVAITVFNIGSTILLYFCFRRRWWRSNQ